MNNLHTVYDFSDTHLGLQVFIPLIMSLAGVGFFFRSFNLSDLPSSGPFGLSQRRFNLYFSSFFTLVFAVLSLFIPAAIAKQKLLRTIYAEHRYTTIEGKVEEHKDMLHGYESFEVNSIPFIFSNNNRKGHLFNDPAPYQTVLKSGMFVSISYYPDGNENVILRLETE